jgi:hypothetical protein
MHGPDDDTAFFDVERGSIVHVVIGTNGEDLIRAGGETTADAWHGALGRRNGESQDRRIICLPA